MPHDPLLQQLQQTHITLYKRPPSTTPLTHSFSNATHSPLTVSLWLDTKTMAAFRHKRRNSTHGEAAPALHFLRTIKTAAAVWKTPFSHRETLFSDTPDTTLSFRRCKDVAQLVESNPSWQKREYKNTSYMDALQNKSTNVTTLWQQVTTCSVYTFLEIDKRY